MNGFEMISATINEPSFTTDELRIIAKDAKGLSREDRASIVRGAEELELSNRSLAMVYAAWIQSQQELAAVRDRLPKAPPVMVFDSLSFSTGPRPMNFSSGWQPVKP